MKHTSSYFCYSYQLTGNALFKYKGEWREKWIRSRNASVFWESERNIDFIHTFLKRKHLIDGSNDKELINWIDRFETNKKETALDFWYEMHKGIQESLREF